MSLYYDIKSREQNDLPLSTYIEYFGQEEGNKEVHLRDYLNVIFIRKWTVFFSLVAVVIAVAFVTFSTRPLYKSSVTIRIDKENPNVLSFKDVYPIEQADQDYYQTQYQILKSRTIAKRVIKFLKLESHKEFQSEEDDSFSIVKLFKAIFILIMPTGQVQNEIVESVLEDGIESRFIDEVLNRVEVEPVRNSQLVNVFFTAHDPHLCKTVANQLAQTYIEFNLDSKLNATEQARKWLERQINIMKERVEESQEKLNNYSAGSEIIFLDNNTDIQNPLLKKLSELSTVLSEVTTKRIEKEALYQELMDSGTQHPIFLKSDLIDSLEKEYTALEADKLDIYTSRYPNMQRLKNKMDMLRKRIDNEKQKIVNAVKSDYNALVKQEAYLTKTYNDQKKRVHEYQKKSIQYQILEREVETNKELYNSLLQRQKEVGVSATMTATNIQIIDKAELPRRPFKPKKGRNILIAVFIGLMAGIGLAFFFEYLDNTVKDSNYLETKMQMPTLGMLPQFKKSKFKNGQFITTNDKNSPIAEVFRSISTFIQFSSSAYPPKIILFTSPGEKEGKTTTAINTAIAMAESVGRGIIIDADLRKSTLHTVLNVDNTMGLSNFLSGNSELNEELIKCSVLKSLDLITAGPQPPNPSELLGSQRMKEIIKFLSEAYDFIIIDSPPLLGMTDSIQLSRFVDGVIMIVRAGSTQKNALEQARKVLMHTNAKILGVVLNGIKESDFRYGYYSSYFE